MLDQGHAGAEAGEHLGDLAPDGPAADDGRGGRQLGGRIEVLAGPEGHRAEAGDARLPEPAPVAMTRSRQPMRDSPAARMPRPSIRPRALITRTPLAWRRCAAAASSLVLGDDVATRHRRGVGLPVAVERERTAMAPAISAAGG